jgi:hypothetical protein
MQYLMRAEDEKKQGWKDDLKSINLKWVSYENSVNDGKTFHNNQPINRETRERQPNFWGTSTGRQQAIVRRRTSL